MRGAAHATIVAAMTETMPPPPPDVRPPTPDGPDRLVRDPDEKVVAGVCAALGRYTDTDPVLWRVSAAVLTLFGGAGLVLYALGWLLLPLRGEPQSVLERTVRRADRGVTPAGVLLVLGGGVALLAVLDDGPGFGALLVLGVLAWLVARSRRDGGPAGSLAAAHPGTVDASGSAPLFGPAVAPGLPDPLTTPYGAPLPWEEPPPARRRSRLGRLTLSAAALVVGLLLALRIAGVEQVTTSRVLAAALLVVGAGLVVGTWVGRARWLLLVGVPLAVALTVSSLVQATDLGDGVGQRTWRATGAASYGLGVGEGLLDLRQLSPGDADRIRASVGAGQLRVLVPDDLAVRVVADVELGVIAERGLGGRRVERAESDDTDDDLHEVFRLGPSAAGADVLELDLEVGLGEIEVRRVAA